MGHYILETLAVFLKILPTPPHLSSRERENSYNYTITYSVVIVEPNSMCSLVNSVCSFDTSLILTRSLSDLFSTSFHISL